MGYAGGTESAGCVTGRGHQVALWRYPCRRCGSPTDGVDTYVICGSCLDELDGETQLDRRLPSFDSAPDVTLRAGEAEAQVRKLLDDW